MTEEQNITECEKCVGKVYSLRQDSIMDLQELNVGEYSDKEEQEILHDVKNKCLETLALLEEIKSGKVIKTQIYGFLDYESEVKCTRELLGKVFHRMEYPSELYSLTRNLEIAIGKEDYGQAKIYGDRIKKKKEELGIEEINLN